MLGWIKGDPNRWQTFISNRIHAILNITKPNQWQHVGTDDNPADCSSRGITVTQLKNHALWWHGPKWLLLEQSEWPIQPTDFEITQKELEAHPEVGAEIKRKYVNVFKASIDSENIIHTYSSFSRLHRIIAWMFHYKGNCHKQRYNEPLSPYITVSE